MERNDVNEIVILDKHRNVKTSCYRKDAGRYEDKMTSKNMTMTCLQTRVVWSDSEHLHWEERVCRTG